MWNWLRDTANQNALKVIGSGIAALAVGGWAIFTWQSQVAIVTPPTTITELTDPVASESSSDTDGESVAAPVSDTSTQAPNPWVTDPILPPVPSIPISEGVQRLNGLFAKNKQRTRWDANNCKLILEEPEDGVGNRVSCRVDPTTLGQTVRLSVTELSVQFRQQVACSTYGSQNNERNFVLKFPSAENTVLALETIDNWEVPSSCIF